MPAMSFSVQANLLTTTGLDVLFSSWRKGEYIHNKMLTVILLQSLYEHIWVKVTVT